MIALLNPVSSSISCSFDARPTTFENVPERLPEY
jgi:hypothetical protein